MPEFYSIGLLVLFYALLVAEFFVPSGGLLGVAAAGSAIASIAVGFTHSFAMGSTMMVIIVFSTPLVLGGLVRLWPVTPMGRKILNRRPGQLTDAKQARRTLGGRSLDELTGRIGTAQSDMLPSGRIQIDDDKLDAVSIGGAINRSENVIVVGVTAGRIRVRGATADEVANSKSRHETL